MILIKKIFINKKVVMSQNKFYVNVNFYDNVNFTGNMEEIPSYSFQNSYPGKKILSLKIPDGVYVTLFKDLY